MRDAERWGRENEREKKHADSAEQAWAGPDAMRVLPHPTSGGYDQPDDPPPAQIENTRERTRRISRASMSGTGRHAGIASPY